jgi:hypothetical protein
MYANFAAGGSMRNIRFLMTKVFVSGVVSTSFFSTALGNVLGVSYQGFFPSPSQSNYITVHSAEGVRENKWRMYVYGSYSGNNLFAYDVPANNQVQHQVEDQLAAGQFGFAYGITPDLEFGFALPFHLGQTINPESDRTYLAQRGISMIHNQLKYVIQRPSEGDGDSKGIAVVASINLPNTRQDGFLGDHQTPIVTMEGVFEKGTQKESYAFNAGLRFRSPGEHYVESPVFPLEDQLIASVGYQRQFEKKPKLSWMAEFFTAYPIDKGAYQRAKDISSAEAIFGLRASPSRSFRWTVGCGTEVLKGTMSPDWRLLAGASWDFGFVSAKKDSDSILDQRPVFGSADEIGEMDATNDQSMIIEDSDRDGIEDDNDMCSRTPRGVKVDKDGCPIDSDNDSIPDFEDRCPKTPEGEVVDGKGCPALKK